MADSNITKKALASALKELMREQSFTSISVANISERCSMNRKSFYYHFKDKYDLIDWIFDSEFLSAIGNIEEPTRWEIISTLVHYLYDNRDFYRPALKIEGQNCFREHFRKSIEIFVTSELDKLLSEEQVQRIHVIFVTSGVVGALEQWILDDFFKDVGPDDFLLQLQVLIYHAAIDVSKEIDKANNNGTSSSVRE